jgi:hypothetical protein
MVKGSFHYAADVVPVLIDQGVKAQVIDGPVDQVVRQQQKQREEADYQDHPAVKRRPELDILPD